MESRACTVKCLHMRTWIHALNVDASFKMSFLLSFSGKKFPRFWKVPTLGAWIWHHFLLSAKLWFLSPSSPMSSLTTWSQPAECLWWWRCSRLCGSQAPSISPWPLRRCQRLLSASEESRFGDKWLFSVIGGFFVKCPFVWCHCVPVRWYLTLSVPSLAVFPECCRCPLLFIGRVHYRYRKTGSRVGAVVYISSGITGL